MARGCGTHAEEVLEVMLVVEDFLGLLADVQDGLHGGDGVLAAQRLRTQQDAVHTVQHSVGNVCSLGPARCALISGNSRSSFAMPAQSSCTGK